MLAVGGVVRTHGVRGHVRVRSYSGETAHIERLRAVRVGTSPAAREYQVEEVREAGGDVLMKLGGVDSPEAAAGLRGLDLWVERESACPLEADEYYVGDLCECRVYRDGRDVGTVRSVIEGGATDLIEVAGASGADFLVPFVKECVVDIHLAQKRICLKEGYEVP